jgi:hypothetical protein
MMGVKFDECFEIKAHQNHKIKNYGSRIIFPTLLLTFRSSITGTDCDLSLRHHVQTQYVTHRTSYSMDNGGHFPGCEVAAALS